MPLGPEQLEPLLRLALVEGIGPHRLARLVDHFGSADAVLAARETDLRRRPGIGPELAGRILAARQPPAIAASKRAVRALDRLGAEAMTIDDPAYPDQLLHLDDRPYLLFTCGNTSLLRKPAVAIVGTRAPTEYGRASANRLSRDLAAAGLVIVSGMARGIDTVAHLACLDHDGETIGVLGHGIDQVYPPEARRLFDRVRSQGLLVTEYPPGERPRAGNFPRRNRLITALSRGVVIVEMGFQSGAQHSVTYALDQGRDVMAVPGPIDSSRSEGTNQLIKDGARMVTGAEDVLEELFGVAWAGLDGVPQRQRPEGNDASSRGDPAFPLVTAEEGSLLRSLDTGPLHVDALAGRIGMRSSEALVLLLDLELRGLVQPAPGMRWAKAIGMRDFPAHRG